MRYTNWQAYEDGSLSPEQMDEARRQLAEDAMAVEEHKGFLAFQANTRKHGLAEEVPTKDLQRMLREVVKSGEPKRRFSWVNVSIPSAAAVLIAIFAMWIKHDPMEFANTPTAAVFESTELVQAASWIKEKTGYRVPDLRLPKEATVYMARYGEKKEWACIDFVQDGKTYFLYMKPDGSSLGHQPTRIFDGNAFYEGQGIGWKTAGLAYYLKGGTREDRWNFAMHLAPQTKV